MDPITQVFRDSPAWEITLALGHIDRARRIAESGAELGVADMRLMWLFSDGEERTMKEIAQALGLDASTVNRQVNGAIDVGLLERGPREGAPGRPVRPTEDGLRRFTKDLEAAIAAMEAALRGVPADEVPDFLRNLGLFASAYRAAADAAVGRA